MKILLSSFLLEINPLRDFRYIAPRFDIADASIYAAA